MAAASLGDAAGLLGVPGWLDTGRTWRDRAQPAADPSTGLLPHRVDAAGQALEGPRSSSQSIRAAARVTALALALTLPVGDAFLAWARSRPATPIRSGSGGRERVRTWWPAWVAFGLLPGMALLVVTLGGGRARSRMPH